MASRSSLRSPARDARPSRRGAAHDPVLSTVASFSASAALAFVACGNAGASRELSRLCAISIGLAASIAQHYFALMNSMPADDQEDNAGEEREMGEDNDAKGWGVNAEDAQKRTAAPLEEEKKEDGSEDEMMNAAAIRVAFGSTTGTAATCSGWVEDAFARAAANGKLSMEIDRVDIGTYDQDNLEQENVMVFVVSTWTGGKPPAKCQVFFEWLEDMSKDFRVDKNSFLARLQFAVIGLGNSDYDDEEYCGAAVKLDDLLGQLGGRRVVPLMKVDDSLDLKPQIGEAVNNILSALGLPVETTELPARKKESKNKTKESRKPVKQKKPIVDDDNEVCEEDEEDRINDMFLNQPEQELGDMEDIIVVGTSSSSESGPREMVTPSQRKSLTKEGYKIIGTHSAVKLCRWTKHHLRGRGGCYKHTFYGITSYQCMEATPSLACANKCVFCWRHHKNPVGKEWRWKMDEPDMIVQQGIELHQNMIKQLKGVPGVQPDRFEQAFTVRHCALSLVGEPIMYPRINEMIRELHKRDISSFLVTNAQFPQAIADLEPVTQLYVSVDAATKDALREVDRPLFKDFWERFTGSLEALREKGQRTVYRLTLVKQWNMMEDELEGYAKLVELGQPDLIEIKAVTYCGKSDGSNLTMQNVPWHHEVRKFADALCDRLGGRYGTACEHVHSCCTLLADKEIYYKGGKWMTWIDYDRFHHLMREYYDSNGEKKFDSSDYIAETPEWAVWGAEEEGFDPDEVRFKRVRAPKNNELPPAGLPRNRPSEQS